MAANMQMDLGLRCIKYLLFAVNSLFVLTGVMIISVGTTIYAVYKDFSHFLDSSYLSPATILIVVGILVFIIAFFGCCGALKESTCMVLVFAISLSMVLVLEFSAAFAAYMLQNNIKLALQTKIGDIMDQYNTIPEAKTAMDVLQTSLHCCGVNSLDDWSIKYNNSSPFPKSCCSDSWNGIFGNEHGTCHVYTDGCFIKLKYVVNRSALYLGTGAIAIALVQLMGIMFALVLRRAIRRQKTERERRRWELRENIINSYYPIGKSDPLTTFPIVYMQPSDFPTKTDNSTKTIIS